MPTANRVAWYDMSNLGSITDAGAGAVSAVADLSGSGFNLAQGTGGARPTTGTRSINGLNVLSFDGGDFMDSSCPMDDRTTTTFILAGIDTNAAAGGQFKLYGSSATGGEALRINADTPNFYRYLCVDKDNIALLFLSDLAPGTGGPSSIRPFIATVVLTGTTVEIRLDNATSSGAESTTFTAARTLRLGAGGTGAEFLDGVVGEFIKYSATLTSGEVDTVIDYLRKKWGLAY
jgi:hypothetical protein